MMVDEILSHARHCLGTPFRHQGRVAGEALDCVGLAAYVATQVGAEFTDMLGYSRLPGDGALEYHISKQPCVRQVSKAQAGDVLVLSFAGEPCHVAICAGDTIIHAYEPSGKVVEHTFNTVWKRRVTHIFRFNESDNR
jgi:cell wall-associated NlpC family hydrolase